MKITKFTKLVFIFCLLIIGIGAYKTYYHLVYDRYDIVSAEEKPIYLFSTEAWGNQPERVEVFESLKKHGIDYGIRNDDITVQLVKGQYKKNFKDLISPRQIIDGYLVLITGPNEIDSGLFRFIFLPTYDEIQILSLEDLSTYKVFRLPFELADARIHDGSMYFRQHEEDKFGRIMVELPKH